MRRWTVLLCFVCAPSGYLAWHGRDMPQLGSLGDDAIYLVSAKSLATGQGYRILSLPGAPAQSKYPPAYPLLLSLVWRINPRFPDNLPIAAWLSWSMLPLLVATARLAFASMGLSPKHATILCGLMALNAPVVWFGMNLMPELAFTSVLLASTLVADADRHWWSPASAGLCGGMAYLLKSAALPLLVTSPLLYLLRKRHRSAGLFFGAMLPFVVGWMWWVRAHCSPPGDSTWTFYTDYFGYQALNVPLSDYPLVVWGNLKTLWSSLGELIAAPALDGALGRVPACAGATVALAGVAMLALRKGVRHYHGFAAGFLPLLAVWHYPPVPRLALPLLPLLLAGLSTAAVEAWRTVSERQPSARRTMAWLVLAVLAMLTPLASTGIYIGPLPVLFRLATHYRQQRAYVVPEYQWIKANTPSEAAFVADDDAVSYLYTGHCAIALHIPPKLLYHGDRRGMAQEYRAIDAFAARNHLHYLLHTTWDFERDFTPALARDIVDHLLSDPQRFRAVHRSQHAAVYEVRAEISAATVSTDQTPKASTSLVSTQQTVATARSGGNRRSLVSGADGARGRERR